jgi:hypothetical protein
LSGRRRRPIQIAGKRNKHKKAEYQPMLMPRISPLSSARGLEILRYAAMIYSK